MIDKEGKNTGTRSLIFSRSWWRIRDCPNLIPRVSFRKINQIHSSGNNYFLINRLWFIFEVSFRIFHWSNSDSAQNSRRPSSSQIIPTPPGGVPDVEVPSEDRLNQSHSSGGFLNSSQGSLLLSDAIKEARRLKMKPKTKRDKDSKDGIEPVMKTHPLFHQFSIYIMVIISIWFPFLQFCHEKRRA